MTKAGNLGDPGNDSQRRIHEQRKFQRAEDVEDPADGPEAILFRRTIFEASERHVSSMTPTNQIMYWAKLDGFKPMEIMQLSNDPNSSLVKTPLPELWAIFRTDQFQRGIKEIDFDDVAKFNAKQIGSEIKETFDRLVQLLSDDDTIKIAK